MGASPSSNAGVKGIFGRKGAKSNGTGNRKPLPKPKGGGVVNSPGAGRGTRGY